MMWIPLLDTTHPVFGIEYQQCFTMLAPVQGLAAAIASDLPQAPQLSRLGFLPAVHDTRSPWDFSMVYPWLSNEINDAKVSNSYSLI